jgi:hypothetical protein
LGITKDQASQWTQLAEIPDEQFQASLPMRRRSAAGAMSAILRPASDGRTQRAQHTEPAEKATCCAKARQAIVDPGASWREIFRGFLAFPKKAQAASRKSF